MKREEYLERCSLSDVKIQALGVKNFLDEIRENGYHLHSFMITRHGKVAYECSWKPYQLEEEHLMHSFTKGLTAAAIGILEGEGRLTLDDTLVSYFPEYQVDDQDGRLNQITIRHLLTMTSGHAGVPDRNGCTDEVLAFLEQPIVNEPGTRFKYDSLGTNMLSSIVKRITSYNLFRFLQQRIFDPMGITGVYCDSCASGRDQSGGGGYLKTEDMAKITILFLNGGVWKGQQLIPKSWIDRMTTIQFEESIDASNPDWEDWRCGYGYQVWMCRIPNTFRFDGLYGQFGIVLKDYDATVITTCGEQYTEAVLRLMWKYLVPAMSDKPLEEQCGIEKELEEYKKDLHIIWPMNHEAASGEIAGLWKKIANRDIIFPENKEFLIASGRVSNVYTSMWTEKHRTGILRLRLNLTEEGCELEYEDNHNHGILPVGINGEPVEGLLRSLWGDYRVWTAARWNKQGSLELQIRMINSEFYKVFMITPGRNRPVLIFIAAHGTEEKENRQERTGCACFGRSLY